jgi:arylsulfatase A-like enzyme
LITGLHTGHGRIRGNDRVDLRPEDTTIAEDLKKAGYTTGICGKWGLGSEGSAGVPTRKGFDFFYGYLDQMHAHNYYPAYLFRNEERVPLKNVVPGAGPFGRGVATTKAQYSHDLVVQEALDFIDRSRAQPFFLYLAFTIPHANNEDKPNGMEVPELGIYSDLDWPAPQKGYAAMVTRMDADVGRIVARLKELGLADNTLVLFSSDNGPHREGGNNPQFNHSGGPLRGIKRDLYEGGIRVPLIAVWPGHVPAGATSDYIGAFWDFFPTLAELAGATDRVPQRLDGISFVPTLFGQSEKQRQHDYLYWAFYEGAGARAARVGNWKGVEQPYGTPLQLFDLQNDVGEKSDVAAAHPEVVQQIETNFTTADTPSDVWKFRKSPAAANAKSNQ